MLTRDSTEPADPGVVPSLAQGWSHDWRKGGPITLAELLPSGPMPLAGDRCAQCQLNSKEISPNPEKTLDGPLVHP